MILRVVLSVLLLASAVRAEAVDYTDIWYNSAESGWGVNLVQSDNTIFATFFVFAQNGTPTWYVASLIWDGTSRYTGDLAAATGGTWFAAPWQPGNLTGGIAGTAAFQPSSSNAYQGTLAYTVTGVGSATKAIERQTLTTIALGGTYTGGQSGAFSGCSASANNASYIDNYDLVVTHLAGGNATFQFDYLGGLSCTLSGTLEQHGQQYRIPSATYTCSDGLNATARLSEIKATALGIEGRLFAPSLGGGCQESASFSAVLQ